MLNVESIIYGINSKKLTSAVWKYFTLVQVGKKIQAKYSGCKNLFAGGGKNGTTHLKDHLRSFKKMFESYKLYRCQITTFESNFEGLS